MPRVQQYTSSLVIPCAHGKLNVKPPDNPETGGTYEYHSRERRSCAGQKIVFQYYREPKRTQAAQQQQQCEYGLATEWDVFHCTPSRGGRGRRAAVDIFRDVFFQCLVGFRVFFVFSTSNAHGLL